MVYVHYRFSVFLPELFVPVRNSQWQPKPDDGTGLWACREEDKLGWRQWSLHSNPGLYSNKRIVFSISPMFSRGYSIFLFIKLSAPTWSDSHSTPSFCSSWSRTSGRHWPPWAAASCTVPSAGHRHGCIGT